MKKGINTAKDVIKQPYCAFTGSLENKFYGGSQIKTVRLFKTLQRLAEEPQNCINGKIILFADELEGLLGTINDNRSHNANQRSVLLRELDTCLKSGKVLIVGGTNMIKNMDSAVQRRAHNILFGVESTELIKAFASNQQLIKDKDELLQKTAVKLAQSILSGIPPAQEISQEEHIAKLILENDSFTIKVPDSMKKQASIIAASYERINEKNQIIFKKRTIPLDHKITVKTLKDNDYLQYVLNTLLPQYSLISSPAAVEDRFAREYDACVQMVQALFTIFKFDAQKVFAFLKLYYKDLKNKNYVVKETNVVSNDVYWKFADENLDAVLDYYQKYISSSRRDNHEDYFKDFINMLKKTKDPREGLYKELFVNNKKFLEYSKAAFESIHNNVLENKQQFDNARKNILEDPSYKKTVKSFSALSKEFQKMFGEDTSLSFIGAISGIAKKMNQLPWIIEAEEKDDTYIFTLVPRTDESYKKEGAEYIEKITSLASEYLSTNDLKLISHNNIYPDSELIEHITSKNIGIFSEPE